MILGELSRFEDIIECCDRALIINPKNKLSAKIKKLAGESARTSLENLFDIGRSSLMKAFSVSF